jgi:hypothetical protein
VEQLLVFVRELFEEAEAMGFFLILLFAATSAPNSIQ